MKIKNLFLLSLISSLSLTSCSDDSTNLQGGGENPNKEEAFFSLRLSFPSSVSQRTTTDEDGDGYQQGLSTEQRFQTVAVVLLDDNNTVVDNLSYTADDFAPDGNSAGDDNTIGSTQDSRIYFTKNPRKVTKGDASVYVYLNPTAEIISTLAVGETVDPSMMIEITPLTSADLTTTYAADDNFLMGNAETPTSTTIDGTVTNPTVVTVAVERFAVKLVENTATASFDIQNTLSATTIEAQFVNFSYNYLNKRAYYLKQTQTINEPDAVAGAYVVDPNFVSSDYNAYSPASPWYGTDFFITGNQGVINPFSTDPVIDYCLENTMISNEQYTNKTTSVAYKAELTIDGQTGTFYTYKNRIYQSYADLETVYNADYPTVPNALSALFTEQQLEDAYTDAGSYTSAVLDLNTRLADVGIKAYYEGQCYYNWPIKHWEQDVLLGRMEFGVVRNNVYYLTVRSIMTIGEPWLPGGPEDPDPDPTPDEDEDAYLSVEIQVLPWVVRNNDIDF